jgi:aspartate kinase
VPIHVRSSFTDIPGTMIVAEPESADQAVGGATLTKDEARVTVFGVPDRPGSSLAIFSRIADKAVSVDMIVQNVGEEGLADITFTVPRDDLRATRLAVDEAVREIGAGGFTCDENVSKVSVVGLGMARQTGVADRMFQALADAGVNIQMISTSEIKISVLVARESAQDALRAVHREFKLEVAPANVELLVSGGHQPPVPPRPSNAVEVVRRLAGMEDLAIDDLSLDDTQARITISHVQDRPGVAAAVFRQIAETDVFVDMIVQGYGRNGQANLSFTVPHQQISRALMDVGKLARSLDCGAVTSSPRVAKLSVSGIGLRSHTGVAIRMFRSLAEAGINVEMINTSEVRVNVVVAGEHGQKAMQCLKKAFADVLL